MGLWVREGRRWKRVQGLPEYRPPVFLRVSPSTRGPAWKLSWPIGPDFGADTLPELLSALLRATSVMPGPVGLYKVVGDQVEDTAGITPFAPQAVRAPGLVFQRVAVEPARWLLTLYLTRPVGKLLVACEEKYVGGWWASLWALQEACRGEGGPPAGSA